MTTPARHSSKDAAERETRMEMTPMIDVTFLLLIFFLCTIKFRILEGKIPAFLPRDVGVSTGPPVPLEKIDIVVERTRSLARCRAEAQAAGRPRPDRSWVWDQNQIEVSVGRRKFRSLDEFHRQIVALLQPYRDRNIPPEDWPKATFSPRPNSLYIDSVKVINECLRAGLTQITFAGPAREG